jgi:hypothetical protein
MLDCFVSLIYLNNPNNPNKVCADRLNGGGRQGSDEGGARRIAPARESHRRQRVSGHTAVGAGEISANEGNSC